MYIKNLELLNYRNYEKLNISFNSNINLILGRNAQGKTNLVEAIYLSSFGKSFRTNKDSDLINFYSDTSKVKVTCVKEDDEINLELILKKDLKKSAKLNGVKLKKASEILDNIYIVIFSPEDLKIVKDEPEKRRKFINRELCQLKPIYYSNLVMYNKILAQRNSYLKENNIDREVLDVWDAQLAKYGEKIIKERSQFIEKIDGISKEIHSNITGGKEDLHIIYNPNVKLEEDLYKILKNNISNDIKQRTTTKGPHKDDLTFEIDGINVRSFGSQGQQRTAALSLKMAEINLIKEETDEDAILLLDDVMSELDEERQEYLLKSLSNTQMFITTTELSEILLKKFSSGSIFTVENGQVNIEEK
ncbi:MAG: DNA replication/repair protein RecF [Clostridia bacterium]|nr:DNA replication/repair protein RecF [Clostridia bacterium]